MAALIYSLCAITACLSALLLLRAFRRSGYRLLLWGGVCFCGLTVNNVLLVIDKVVIPTAVDLSLWRHFTALGAMIVLLYGLIWEKE